jgi:hypothetical protein
MVSTRTETCANCGRTIGKLETPFIHVTNVVCRECYDRLNPVVDAEPVPSRREPAPTYPVDTSNLVPCPACGRAIARGTTKCPHCGKTMGFDIGRFLLLFIFVIVVLWIFGTVSQGIRGF